VPQTPAQALGFVLGLWIAVWLLFPRASLGAELEFAPLEAELEQAVNDVRSREGLIALLRDPRLDAVARAHSADMAQRRYLSHDTPEGQNPVDRLRQGGASGFTLAGENVGLTSKGDPNREILEAWLASPAHRGNLLAPAFNATGVGIARGADGTLYYTQLYVTYKR